MLSTLIVPLIALQLQGKTTPAQKPSAPAKSTVAITSRPLPTKVLATVNGVSISAGEVEPYLWDWKSDEVVDNLVNFEIVNIEAKRLHITTTPQEVQKTIDDELAQFKTSLPAGTDPATALRQRGYPPSRIKLTVRSSVLLDKIAMLDFKPADYVNISTIIVKTKTPSPEDVAAATKSCQEFYDRLAKGELWAAVLASSTTDANVIKNNGLIGWRALSAFPKEAVAEVTKLKQGQYTKPITTPYGVQIFRLEQFGSQAQPGALQQLKTEFVQTHRNEVLTSLRAKAKIVKVQ